MKRVTISIFIFTAAIFICSNVKSQNSNLANLDEFITNYMDNFYVPGLSACIIKGDSIVWHNNYGLMNREDSIPVHDSTLFNTWSIQKSIIAACAFQLIEDGLLGLDQNINDFMPFQIDNPWTTVADNISPRMLMSHSSSISDWALMNYITIGNSTTALDFFFENYLCPGGIYYDSSNYHNMIPGTEFHYDSFGPAVGALSIEKETGNDFSQHAQDSLLSLLDMNKSTWFLSDSMMDNLATGYAYSGGGVYEPQPHYGHPAYPAVTFRSTVLELSNFVIMLLNQGTYNGLNILSAASIDSMTTVQNPDWGNEYGITGLGLLKRENFGNRVVWGHQGGAGGGGYSGHINFCKEENTGIVILNNSNNLVYPIVLQLFEYAGLFLFTNNALQITDSSFIANWQPAATATGYLLDVALDEEFENFVNGLENHDVGLDTNYHISGLNSNTDYFYRVRAYNSADTGAYSNLICLTTNLGTGMNESLIDKINIWSFENTVYINLPENPKIKPEVVIYTISGNRLLSASLKEGMNKLKINLKQQILLVNIHMSNKNYSKKVLIWK